MIATSIYKYFTDEVKKATADKKLTV